MAWLAVILTVWASSSCGSSATVAVAEGEYGAIVPSDRQFESEAALELPGGFAVLQESGVSRLDVVIDSDLVSFSVNGAVVVERRIVERMSVQDREGSGPFKGTKEVLGLGDEPLELGELTIERPVVWPGSFESSPTITLKPRDDAERGPGVSCGPDEQCLLLSRAPDPTGTYEAILEPGRAGPVAAIEVSGERVVLNLASGERIDIDRADEESTDACGIALTPVWAVPADAGLPLAEPVLVHTVCPYDPGAAIQLVIIERNAIPLLAPLTTSADGFGPSAEWCDPGPSCLWFAPT